MFVVAALLEVKECCCVAEIVTQQYFLRGHWRFSSLKGSIKTTSAISIFYGFTYVVYNLTIILGQRRGYVSGAITARCSTYTIPMTALTSRRYPPAAPTFLPTSQNTRQPLWSESTVTTAVSSISTPRRNASRIHRRRFNFSYATHLKTFTHHDLCTSGFGLLPRRNIWTPRSANPNSIQKPPYIVL